MSNKLRIKAPKLVRMDNKKSNNKTCPYEAKQSVWMDKFQKSMIKICQYGCSKPLP
jgi:hypothetical protein